MRRIHEPFEKIWVSLQEPRSVTFIMVLTYFAGLVGGTVYFVFGNHNTPLPVLVHNMIVSGFFVAAGLLGIPSAWRGRWWLERIAVLFVVSAATLRMIVSILALPASTELLYSTLPWFFLILFMLTRWLRVRLVPYRPGSGPLPAEQKAAIVRAAIEAEDRKAKA